MPVFLEFTYDPKEAAAIDRRRKNEAERRRRIFNARERQFGIDKKTLEEQVTEQIARQDAERQEKMAYQQIIAQNSNLALLTERNQEKEKRRLMQDLNNFRKLCQRPEDGASFDLNSPDRLKKSFDCDHNDTNLVSGKSDAQRFEGEDLDNEKRRELQRKQQKSWLDQQIREKTIAETVRQNEDASQECSALLLDRKAVELERAEQEVRKLQHETLVTFNKALIAEKEICQQERVRLELLDNQAEMSNCIRGDFLLENPEVAASALGPHRVIPDRWKGMSSEQRLQIRKEQLQQALQQKKRKEEEEQVNAEWKFHMNELDRCAVQIERELMRKKREESKEMLNLNHLLSKEQQARNEYSRKCASSNSPTEEYYKQFNTSSR